MKLEKFFIPSAESDARLEMVAAKANAKGTVEEILNAFCRLAAKENS